MQGRDHPADLDGQAGARLEVLGRHRLAGEVRVDHRPAALGQGDEAGRLGHRDRQPAAQLGEHPGLGLEREGRRRPPRGPHDPALAAVVVDEGHVVLVGAAGPAARRPGSGSARARRRWPGRRAWSAIGSPAHRRPGRDSYRGGVHTRGGLGPPLADLALARSDLQRSGERRSEPDLLARLLADPATRVLEVADGRAPVDADLRLVLRAPDRRRTTRSRAAYLGDDARGTSYVAAERPDPGRGLADAARGRAALDDRAAGLLAEAVALSNWHATHPRCPRCGAPTEVGPGRLDPGLHERRQRALPAHRPGGDHGRRRRRGPAAARARRRLAGGPDVDPGRFRRAGESLEAAVRREVDEEVGLQIGDVLYRGSQPWPFPASIMLGFRAYATTTEISRRRRRGRRRPLVHPGVDARPAIATGELLISPSISIARRLIEDWFGGRSTRRDFPPR